MKLAPPRALSKEARTALMVTKASELQTRFDKLKLLCPGLDLMFIFPTPQDKRIAMVLRIGYPEGDKANNPSDLKPKFIKLTASQEDFAERAEFLFSRMWLQILSQFDLNPLVEVA